MKRLYIIFIVVLLAVTGLHAKDENPLLQLVGRSYAEYHDAYMPILSTHLHGDSLSRVKLVRMLGEVASLDKSGEWRFLEEIAQHTVRFYDSRKGGFVWRDYYNAENYTQAMQDIAVRAGAKGCPLIRIYALYQAAEGYNVFVQDYERAFACYLEAAAELENVSTRDFPPRPHIYNQIAGLHYTFKEYKDAAVYFRKVTDDPFAGEYNYYCPVYSAMNGLGLCYRNGYQDYERSDSCFLCIREQVSSDADQSAVWTGIVEANIGYNYYLRDNLDEALAWLIPAIEKITRPNDFAFLSVRAVNVADIYLRKNNPVMAKKYIDIALDYQIRTQMPEKDSWLYDVLSRYYTYLGNKTLSNAFLDSTLMSVKKENEAFSGLVLRRVEQQLRFADQRIYEKEINEEKIQSRFYMQIAISVSMALVIILALLGMVLFFYRRQRNAYRELVRRGQSWAGIGNAELSISEKTTVVEENDRVIMTSIEQAMTKDKLYKRVDLTLDVLAREVGFNRYYISTALNRSTGKNFNVYINEYRIKEAIRLISETSPRDKTMGDIAFESGFNDRTTFHRAFKKITGLSPGDFKKNMRTR